MWEVDRWKDGDGDGDGDGRKGGGNGEGDGGGAPSPIPRIPKGANPTNRRAIASLMDLANWSQFAAEDRRAPSHSHPRPSETARDANRR